MHHRHAATARLLPCLMVFFLSHRGVDLIQTLGSKKNIPGLGLEFGMGLIE
jgi:hypothetical protein